MSESIVFEITNKSQGAQPAEYEETHSQAIENVSDTRLFWEASSSWDQFNTKVENEKAKCANGG